MVGNSLRLLDVVILGAGIVSVEIYLIYFSPGGLNPWQGLGKFFPCHHSGNVFNCCVAVLAIPFALIEIFEKFFFNLLCAVGDCGE